MNTITLAGKTYPMCFGFLALKNVSQHTGFKMMNEIEKNINLDISDTVIFIHALIENGCYNEGLDAPTMSDVEDAMNKDIGILFEGYRIAQGQIVEVMENANAKSNGQKKRQRPKRVK